MKIALKILLAVLLLVGTLRVRGQGKLVYDQQSWYAMGNFTIQGNEPIGQSFTPSLSGVGFIQLDLFDGNSGNGLGATLAVNLRSGSITGTILGTATITLADGFNTDLSPNNIPTFYFSSPVSVTPGTMYYFDVSVLSGDTWKVGAGGSGGYAGGPGYVKGVANPAVILQFQEGTVVPEPSTAWLALAGGGLFFCFRRWQKSPRRQT